MSSSYSSPDWVLSHWVYFTERRFICMYFTFCLILHMLYWPIVSTVGWTWRDWSLVLRTYLLSVLRHCWLGHLTCKNLSAIRPIMCLVGCQTLLNPKQAKLSVSIQDQNQNEVVKALVSAMMYKKNNFQYHALPTQVSDVHTCGTSYEARRLLGQLSFIVPISSNWLEKMALDQNRTNHSSLTLTFGLVANCCTLNFIFTYRTLLIHHGTWNSVSTCIWRSFFITTTLSPTTVSANTPATCHFSCL